jgi:hypothetical protein
MMPSKQFDDVRGAIRRIAGRAAALGSAAALVAWAGSGCATGDAPPSESESVIERGDPAIDAGTASAPGSPPGDASVRPADASRSDARAESSTTDATAPDAGSDATPTCRFTSQRYCNGQCIDVQLDPLNCGACGHGCMGQPCVQGACTPVTLSTQFTPLGGLAQDASTIYFVGGDGALRSNVNPGLFTDDRQTFAIDRARVCLDCGHVMLFFGGPRLDQLRREIASLAPKLD